MRQVSNHEAELGPSESVAGLEADAVSDDQLIAMLVDRARSDGLQLTGEGGLLQQLTKRVLESALEGEITDHLGYDKHDPAGKGSGNSRNGSRSKTVLTDVGPVEVKVPRDVAGTFEPQIVRKRQRRLTGVDEMVLSLSDDVGLGAQADAVALHGLDEGVDDLVVEGRRRGSGPCTRAGTWATAVGGARTP
jgi:hypothetical protein